VACVASHLIEEVTAHAQSDSLEDMREICADGTYFPNNLRITVYASYVYVYISRTHLSGRLEYNSIFLGLGVWGVRDSERKICQ